MEKIDSLLPKRLITHKTVNSLDKSIITVNSNTVNSDPIWQQIEDLLNSRDIKPEGVAHYIAEILNDTRSLNYYVLLAKEHDPTRLLEAAHLTKEAWNGKRIRSSMPIYFIAILKKWRYRTRFKE